MTALRPRYVFLVLAFIGSVFRIVQAQSLNEQVAAIENKGNDSLKTIELNKLAVKIGPTDLKGGLSIIEKSLQYANGKNQLVADCYKAKGFIYRENFKINESIDSYDKALDIYQRLKDYKNTAIVYEKIGGVHKKNKDFSTAVKYYEYSIEMAKKSGDTKTIRKSYKECATTMAANGNNPKALSLLLEGSAYANQQHPNDYYFQAAIRMDAAYNLFITGNYNEALNHALDSYDAARKSKDEFQLLDAYNTIGSCYKNIGKPKESVEWFEKAITVLEKSPDKKGHLANVLTNVGIAYYEMGENAKGLEYKKRALLISQEINNQEAMMNNFIAIGIDLIEKDKNYKEGATYLKQAEALSDEHGSLYSNQYVYEGLYKAYDALGEHQNAFKYLQKYLITKDSIMSTEKQKQISELEARYDTDKKQQQIELLNRNRKIQELQLLQNQLALDQEMSANAAKASEIQLLEKDKLLKDASLKKQKAEAQAQRNKANLLSHQKQLKEKEIRNQRYIIYSFIAGVILLGFLLVSIFRSNKQKQRANLEISRQKAELQMQKDIVDEKNKEILDSISYAKRLQNAILPAGQTISAFFPESFVLYKPKDIVAGDFYWFEKIDENNIAFAAADCTGHGVPGALVSVVCHNALNRAVKEYKLVEPGRILDKTRELVIAEFGKNNEVIKDGMDISLCVYDKSTLELKWAGANNPICIIDNNDVIEIKPNKQPIGLSDNPTPFNTHNLKLQKGQNIYLFTDGYADQFGGDKGKKLKYANLITLLKSVAGLETNQQFTKIDTAFEEWRGDLEQVDDVCIIGIKV